MKPTKQDLLLERTALRLELLAAGARTVRFLIEEANDGGFYSVQAAIADDRGALLTDTALISRVSSCLTRWVDLEVPGWSKGDGGRSQIDWALDADAFDHRHYDHVRIERRRLLGEAPPAASQILAENAAAAVLAAMGDLAPADKSSRQQLREALRAIVDHNRTDQARFLSAEQRELLIEGIAGTRVTHGNEAEWIADVVRNGYTGYEFAPDMELVQKLATESLDDVVDGIVGTPISEAGKAQQEDMKQELVTALTLPQSLEALYAVAEAWGEDMLDSLREVGVIEADEESAEVPQA